MIIAITGGTGFVGQAVISRLVQDGHEVRVLTRNDMNPEKKGVQWVRWLKETANRKKN